MQHGESKSKDEDPARPLTDDGRKSVENVGAHLARLGITFDRVFHSGKLRAQQTAEILAGSLKINEKLEAHKGLILKIPWSQLCVGSRVRIKGD